MRLTEQVDQTDGFPPTYTWLLSGVAYKHHKTMANLGWKWLRGAGCKGGYRTSDESTARAAADKLRLTVVSNSTHKIHGLEMRIAAISA